MHRLLLNICVAAAVLAAAVPCRAAETAAPPSHLAAYNLAWLNYLDPADVPATRYAICLVDSGVRVTPDTPATSPEGPIIARLAVDGGPGEPEGDSFEHLHGTRMAMAMAAPQNDWGTIGTWTGARIVSVRGTTAGESSFRAEDYAVAISSCIKYQENTGVRIAAINLSLGCQACALSDQDRAVLEDRIARAHKYGISVLAAAGNGAGAVETPASVTGVLAVAGGDLAGALCSYSSFGPEVGLVGPACPVDAADPSSGEPESSLGGGSSVATAVCATLLAALRTLRPDAVRDQAESWARDASRTVDGHPVLDGRASALAAGLDEALARAEARERSSSPNVAQAPAPPAAAGGPSAVGRRPSAGARLRRWPRPRVAIARWRRGRLLVRVLNRPARARVRLDAERLRADGLGVRSRSRVLLRRSRLVVALHRRPGRIRLRFVSAGSVSRAAGRIRLLYRHGLVYR